MKVVAFDTESRAARLELTRRNLEALLHKLNYNRDLDALGVPDAQPRSECTLISPSIDDPPGTVAVVAVENEKHYANRPPGEMLDNATGEVY